MHKQVKSIQAQCSRPTPRSDTVHDFGDRKVQPVYSSKRNTRTSTKGQKRFGSDPGIRHFSFTKKGIVNSSINRLPLMSWVPMSH